jgi:hypothetical protein
MTALLLILVAPLAPERVVDSNAERGYGLQELVGAYPQALAESTKRNILLWKDGTEMVYDDGIVKQNFEELLAKASLKDQMSMLYPRGWPAQRPEANRDPGRLRHEPFFLKMYGRSSQEVERSLEDVAWAPSGPGKTVRFNGRNGAAKALESVAVAIDALPPEVKQYVARPAGTFHWRRIAHERRCSPHSFGIAIDFQLPRPVCHYWRWDVKDPAALCRYPDAVLEDNRLGQIVRIFEEHGFIWGGKWYHYDTMHFEYRPELLLQGRAQSMGAPGQCACKQGADISSQGRAAEGKALCPKGGWVATPDHSSAPGCWAKAPLRLRLCSLSALAL